MKNDKWGCYAQEQEKMRQLNIRLGQIISISTRTKAMCCKQQEQWQNMLISKITNANDAAKKKNKGKRGW